MKLEDTIEIRDRIGALVHSGEASLLLGSGFSIMNETSKGRVPGSDSLRDAILSQVGLAAGPKTTLKDAYVLGDREITDFPEFLKSLFTVDVAPKWQEKLFEYAWKRIYTTNIDNVLDVAHMQAAKNSKVGGDYKFINYCDPSLVSESIGSIPVISIHGTCSRLEDGFIFSSLEYAKATTKTLDWHRDLAAKALAGGLIVIGNQLDESDLDAYIAQREIAYPKEELPRNWIVMPTPDPIKAANYKAAGYYVIDCTAEEFFTELYSLISPRSIGEIVIASSPAIRKSVSNIKALTWFRGAMSPIAIEIESAQKKKGILRNFIMGAEPDWFYITQTAHAETTRSADLTRIIGQMISTTATGIGVLNVTGPSGSGKTTTLKSALQNLVATYPFSYEFNEGAGLDTDLLREIISGFTQKSILVFYSSFEFYFAVNYIANHFNGKNNPYCLFILEDRTGDHRKSARQLGDHKTTHFEIGDLSKEDALSIAKRIAAHGLSFTNFSEHPLDRQAKIIVDKERGYAGDLLTTLFSLTAHENFQDKIHQDYYSIREELPQSALEAVAIVHSLGFSIPISYLAGFLDISVSQAHKLVETDLAGILLLSTDHTTVRCRHRIIAEFYFRECIARHGSTALILGMLAFLSRQFTVADIRQHPLPYRIYKELVSFEFLFDQYFSDTNKFDGTAAVYHECQRYFGTDGLFWLQFGMFYRKTGNLDEAIDCYKTGLGYYESFQGRHSLGVALLERYTEKRALSDYTEGVDLLETERLRRGTSDAYPTGTLIDWLTRILRVEPGNKDADQRLKNCVAFGLKHFSSDEYVSGLIRKHFS